MKNAVASMDPSPSRMVPVSSRSRRLLAVTSSHIRPYGMHRKRSVVPGTITVRWLHTPSLKSNLWHRWYARGEVHLSLPDALVVAFGTTEARGGRERRGRAPARIADGRIRHRVQFRGRASRECADTPTPGAASTNRDPSGRRGANRVPNFGRGNKFGIQMHVADGGDESRPSVAKRSSRSRRRDASARAVHRRARERRATLSKRPDRSCCHHGRRLSLRGVRGGGDDPARGAGGRHQNDSSLVRVPSRRAFGAGDRHDGRARAACFVESLGARELLLKSLEGAIRRGDEALMDAVSAAVAAHSRYDAPAVELMAVGGSQVGAASQRPPGVELVHLHHSGRTIRVHESSWEEAGLAWRIWGASRILAHALDAAAAAERRSHTAETIATGTDDVPVSSTSPRAVPVHRDDPVPTTSGSARMRVVGRRVLELGAGCGLCGLAAAAVGAREVVLTEGAPGRARGARALRRGRRPSQPRGHRSPRSSTGATTKPPSTRARTRTAIAASPVRTPAGPRASGTGCTSSRARRRRRRCRDSPADETFNLIVGSDLPVYDESHAAPSPRAWRDVSRGRSTLERTSVCAVRRGAHVASLAVAARRRGLRVGARALAPFEGEDGELRERQGGHITRAEPEGVGEWRESGGEAFAEGRGDRRGRRGRNDHESTTFGEEEAAKLTAAVVSLEGRVAMLTMRWPTRRGAGRGAGG